MGIKGFGALLKKISPRAAVETRPLRDFSGQRIAVDVMGYMYKAVYGAKASIVERITIDNMQRPELHKIEKGALDLFMKLLGNMMNAGLTPVCVFDGRSHSLKAETKQKRREAEAKARSNLAATESRFIHTEAYAEEEPVFVQETSQETFELWKQQTKRTMEFSPNFILDLKSILEGVGFPVLLTPEHIEGIGDGEALCASLCLQGNDLCQLSFTVDSDYHVFGGDVAITKITKKGTEYYAEYRSLESILNESELSFDSFRDLCIMLGTDFNTNMKGIALARSVSLIRKYGSIDELSKVMDTSALNYEEVKAIFSSSLITLDRLTIEDVTFNDERFRTQSRDILNMYDLGYHTDAMLQSTVVMPPDLIEFAQR